MFKASEIIASDCRGKISKQRDRLKGQQTGQNGEEDRLKGLLTRHNGDDAGVKPVKETEL